MKMQKGMADKLHSEVAGLKADKEGLAKENAGLQKDNKYYKDMEKMNSLQSKKGPAAKAGRPGGPAKPKNVLWKMREGFIQIFSIMIVQHYQI